jgi:hypothetical protein
LQEDPEKQDFLFEVFYLSGTTGKRDCSEIENLGDCFQNNHTIGTVKSKEEHGSELFFNAMYLWKYFPVPDLKIFINP